MDTAAHWAGWPGVAATAISVAGLIALGVLLTRSLLSASNLKPASLVAVSLSLLTLVALGGFILTANDILGTLAATGFGAIAGALTTLFGDSRQPPSDDSDDKRVP